MDTSAGLSRIVKCCSHFHHLMGIVVWKVYKCSHQLTNIVSWPQSVNRGLIIMVLMPVLMSIMPIISLWTLLYILNKHNYEKKKENLISLCMMGIRTILLVVVKMLHFLVKLVL